ncbi:MAG: hypothetical protein AB1589_07900 [Cyanobacteriota bacterium]
MKDLMMKKELWLELSEREAESIKGGTIHTSGILYPVIVRFTSDLHKVSLQGDVQESGQVPIFGGSTGG